MYTLIAAIGALLIYVVGNVIYNWLFHPLSRYPGPFLWRITHIPSILSTQAGRIHRDLLLIHERYGPIVRVSPDELSFVEAQAIRDIYGRRDGRYPFPKNPNFYRRAPNGAHYLSTAPDDEHPRIRQSLSRAFSDKAVSEQEPLVKGHVDLLLKKLTGLVQDTGVATVDIQQYFSYVVFDIIGDLGLGQSFDCLGSQQSRDLVGLLFMLPKAGVMEVSLSSYKFLTPLLYFILPRDIMEKSRRLWQLCIEKVHQRMGMIPDRKDLMTFIIPNEDGKGLSGPEIEANGFLLMFAGAETTASLLSAAVSFLVRNPEQLRKLRCELQEAFESMSDMTFRSCARLPYLNAVLQESLRLAPPIAGSLTRLVPSGGGTICGEYIPSGMTVGVCFYAAHRYSHNFTYPREFLPERWLQPTSPLYKGSRTDPLIDSETFVGDHKDAMQAFSLGPRNCAGVNLAWAEMRLLLASLLWTFDVTPEIGEEPLVWELQKIYSTWERVPLNVQLMRA